MGMINNWPLLYKFLSVAILLNTVANAQAENIPSRPTLSIQAASASTIENIVNNAKQSHYFQCKLVVPNPVYDNTKTPDEPAFLKIPIFAKTQKLPSYSHELLVTSLEGSSELNRVYQDKMAKKSFVQNKDYRNHLHFKWQATNGIGSLDFEHITIRLYPEGGAKMIGKAKMKLETYSYEGSNQLADCNLIQLKV